MNLQRASEILKSRCIECDCVIASQFAKGGHHKDLGLIMLYIIDNMGVSICVDCLRQLSKRDAFYKEYHSFCKKYDSVESDAEFEALIGSKPTFKRKEFESLAGKIMMQEQKQKQKVDVNAQKSTVVIHAGGESMGGSKKQQTTYHIRNGGTVNKAYCDVKGESVDIVVVDDEQVRVGCRYYSQGERKRGCHGTCTLRSGWFNTRMCIFSHNG